MSLCFLKTQCFEKIFFYELKVNVMLRSVEVDPCSNRVSINPTHYKNATSTSVDDNVKIQRRMSRIEQRRLR